MADETKKQDAVTTAPKKKPGRKPYLTKEELKAELAVSHERGQLTNKNAKMFQLMVSKIQSRVFYKDPAAKEDCAAHAMYIVAKNWHKFDMTQDNPFGFFTTTIINALSAGWNANERRPIHIPLDAFINNDADKAE
ncbi:sigma-70 region 2 [Chryseobacterium phage MA9V-2]|nr:sigma-70 region 2 [Chryseobacterium phage MA9V-2]